MENIPFVIYFDFPLINWRFKLAKKSGDMNFWISFKEVTQTDILELYNYF